jgi:hypothetical protein
MDEAEARPATLPPNISISMEGFTEEALARSLCERVAGFLQAMSTLLDLRDLIGATVAMDYPSSLAALDQGIPGVPPLTPSAGEVVGVGMAAKVVRDGVVKSHIVLNANFVLPLLDESHAYFSLSLGLLAHECGHVHVDGMLYRQFTDALLTPETDYRLKLRNLSAWGVWGEFAACYFAAGIGEDPEAGYLDCLSVQLESSLTELAQAKAAYQSHLDHERTATEMAALIASLMKIAAYVQGNRYGFEVDDAELPGLPEWLTSSWFYPFYELQDSVLRSLVDDFGEWASLDRLDVMGDVVETILGQVGVTLIPVDGGCFIHIE